VLVIVATGGHIQLLKRSQDQAGAEDQKKMKKRTNAEVRLEQLEMDEREQ
jgi:hypothetical protein